MTAAAHVGGDQFALDRGVLFDGTNSAAAVATVVVSFGSPGQERRFAGNLFLSLCRCGRTDSSP
jgi:hypothetical protein